MTDSPVRLPLVLDMPSPCSVPWDAMSGDDRVRHCATCDREIHNLAVLTDDEIAELVANPVCVRMEARDGALVSAGQSRAVQLALATAFTALAACNPADHPVGTVTAGPPPPHLPTAPVAPSASATPTASPTAAASASVAIPEPPTPTPSPPRTSGSTHKVGKVQPLKIDTAR